MATDRLIGHDLARYHIEAVLGRGGMGVVYRATDMRLGRTVALKVLSDERSADPDFRERFLRESRLLASIDHPNIVPIYEADEADGQLYIAMRYVPGPELRQIIADEAPMDAGKTVAIIGQVADALDAAHVAGLVHRDVKPGNILVMPGATSALAGHAYLTDFGLTKSTGSDTGLTKIGQFVGTPGYVAPEQIEGRGVDHRADIYALGCILYNCLSGDVPYPRDSTVASLWAHLKEPPPRLSEHRKGLPKGLDAVITRALAKSPDDRYQTCGALAQAAREAIETKGRRRVAAAGVAAGAAAAAVGAGSANGHEIAAATMTDATVVEATAPGPGVAGATVIESSPTAAVPVAAGAAAPSTVVSDAAIASPSTVVEDGSDTALDPPPDETVVESRDTVPIAVAATLLDGHDVAAAPPPGGPVASPDASTQAGTVVAGPVIAGPLTKPRATSPLAGRAKTIAAALVAAVLLGGGLLGYTVVNGDGSGGGTGGASPTPGPSVAVVQSAAAGTYIALAGDTLATIAAKLGVTIEQLLAINPGLSGGIVIGQSILIPLDEPTAAPTPVSSASDAVPSTTPGVTPAPTSKPPAVTAKPRIATPKPPDDKTPPTNPSITIAGGSTVYSTTVKLALKAGGATEMRLGNQKGGSCDWGGWGAYKTSRSGWTLVGGSGGSRTVCVQFRDAAGNPSGDKDSIYYDRKPTAANNAYNMTPGCSGYLAVLSNDSDPDGDSLTVTGVTVNDSSEGHAEIASNHQAINYYSEVPWQHDQTLTYTIGDGHGGSDSASISIHLYNPPPCPT